MNKKKPMVYKCYYAGCNAEYARKTNLMDHLNKHIGVKKYLCDLCGATFFMRRSLYSHYETHKGKNFQCEKCGNKFIRKNNLLRHALICQRVFQCGKCNKNFIKKGNLDNHMLRKHSERIVNYICSICGAGFKNNSSLYAHKKIKHENRRYPCKYCNKTYSYNYSLKEHIEKKHHHENNKK